MIERAHDLEKYKKYADKSRTPTVMTDSHFQTMMLELFGDVSPEDISDATRDSQSPNLAKLFVPARSKVLPKKEGSLLNSALHR